MAVTVAKIKSRLTLRFLIEFSFIFAEPRKSLKETAGRSLLNAKPNRSRPGREKQGVFQY
jgi:hypothetical protein